MTNDTKLPSVITETEGEWARDAAYALEHRSDPATFPAEALEAAYEHMDALASAACRKAERRFYQDFERMINALLDGLPRKEQL